jgi:Ca-activated chloride channel family protein
MNPFNYDYANPGLLWLLVLLPLILAYYIWRMKKLRPSQRISSVKGFSKAKRTWRPTLIHILPALVILGFAFSIIALARPQTTSNDEKITTEGIDMVLALDVSTSMLARDFKPDRLRSAVKVAQEFIAGRRNDRIGLVVFAGESFTQCPITNDHNVLQNLLAKIQTGLLEDGTAIGMGIATAVDRLKDTDSKSKVIILLTDGENNQGFIDPLTAAEIAKQFGIRIYTIGIGSKGMAPYPYKLRNGQTVMQDVEVKIDEELLKQIAEMTGVSYFRATNERTLREIYSEIDKLEKTKISVATSQKKNEKFLVFVLVALGCFLSEFILKHTLFSTIP